MTRRPAVFALLVMLSILPAGLRAAPQEAKSRDDANARALDGLEGEIEAIMAEWKMPGLAIAVVKDGQVILCRGFGYRDLENKRPVTAKTLFAIGSISKSFTATGLGILAEQGKLDWDRPVRAYLPEFQLRDKVANDGTTTRDLLTHRTGLPRHDRVWYGSGLSRRAMIEVLRHLEPSQEFRATWQYNNLMYLAAGVLDEAIAGKPWEDLTRERIFRPLGMDASNFSVAASQRTEDYALPYDKVKDEVRRIRFYTIDTLAPAGAINSNVEEMIRYVQLHIDKGKYRDQQVFPRRIAEAMQTPQMVVPDDAAGPLHAPKFDELGHLSYGQGFFVTTYRGHELVWHSGSIDGFSALMSFLPHEKAGVIVLTNLSGNRPVPLCATRSVLDRLLGLERVDWASRAKELDKKAEKERDEARKKAESERKTGTNPSHAPKDYAGTYEHPAYGKVTVSVEGDGLTFSWRGASAPLVHRHYDIFETGVDEESTDDSTIPKVRVSFSYDPKGDINRLAMPLESKVADILFARRKDRPEDSKPVTTVAGRLGDADEAFDIVILGGKVMDGTGNAWFLGDVALRGDRIVRITPAGRLKDAPAGRRVDAAGMVVAPGFIDIQGHSREQLLTGDGRVIGKITQGVTTEILGEGTTNAPSKQVKEFDGTHGFDAWLEAMRRHGASVNFGSFLGSATVRSYVKGMAQGAPTSPELEAMKGLVRDAMEDGAFGLGSALIYPPDSFVGTADLIELCKVMAPYGGVYITHMRSEADRLLEAIDEAIEIGRKGGVPVEIYHLKAAGRRNWDKARRAIDKIAEARARGQDVGADMYPYTAGGTGLTACLPPSAAADGKLFENLADPVTRAAIREEVLHPTSDWENLGELATPRGVLVLGLKKPENRKHVGKRLSEIAEAEGKPWVDAAMDLILSERQSVDTIYFMMSEENLALQLQQPWIKFGTDAGGHDPDHPEGLVHPRSYGTFPRILGKYARDEGVLPLEEAIRKMTSAVAGRLSIRDRGLLREGLYADLVVFDPATIGDKATYEQPHQLSVGVRDVFVNGVAVVRDGRHTWAKPGRIVRGPGYRAAVAEHAVAR